MKNYILPSLNWVGWQKTLPDTTRYKEIAHRTKRDLESQGYITRQKHWKDYGIITYYADRSKILDPSVQFYFLKQKGLV